MRFSVLFAISGVSMASAFTGSNVPFKIGNKLSTNLYSTRTTPVVVTGNNVEVTPAIRDYVDKKMEKTLGKLTRHGFATECDVHLSVNKNPKVKKAHKTEITTTLKGTVIRTSEENEDMYASIDIVTDRLARKLRKYKERRVDGHHGGVGVEENIAKVLEAIPDVEPEVAAPAEEEYIDPEAPTITKVKSFDLSKGISLDEAVFALDYIDHDFYVYRDAESNEINVVYKRNAGGIGLIQPQQD
jgi:putative sigma-54 modulation protein